MLPAIGGSTGRAGSEGGSAADSGARVGRSSSSRISSSSVFRSSFEARLNSARLFPSERPSSGSLRGPKMIKASTKMMISSGTPTEPSIGQVYTRWDAGTGAGADPGTLWAASTSSCYDAIMRSPRFVPVVALAVLLSALAGGFFGSTVLAKQDQVQ